jgi:hypothetical protein
MLDRVIIEDQTDREWLVRHMKRCKQALIDPRTREDEKDGWRVRLGRIDDRLEYLERKK